MTDSLQYTNVSSKVSNVAFRFGKPPQQRPNRGQKHTMKKNVLKDMVVGETISTKCMLRSTPIHDVPSICQTQQRWKSVIKNLPQTYRDHNIHWDIVCYQNTTYIKRTS